jgi:Rieske Fe-S protein
VTRLDPLTERAPFTTEGHLPVKNPGIDRRTVLSGAAALATGATLAACGSETTSAVSSVAASSAAATTKATAIGSMPPASAADSSGSASNGAAAENALGQTADIAVGGGMIYAAANVVVTQPTADTFKAFSASCTHQGCTVGSIEGDAIICPCHNSKFSITDGSVLQGPATAPLPEQKVTVTGGAIKLG